MTHTPADVAKAYLAALESRAPVEVLTALLHDDAVIEVLPNLLDRRGSSRTRAEALSDVPRGRSLLLEERYEVLSTLEQHDRCVLEVAWQGTLAVPLGALGAGATLRARCSFHFLVLDGKVAHQRNYDCFEPW